MALSLREDIYNIFTEVLTEISISISSSNIEGWKEIKFYSLLLDVWTLLIKRWFLATISNIAWIVQKKIFRYVQLGINANYFRNPSNRDAPRALNWEFLQLLWLLQVGYYSYFNVYWRCDSPFNLFNSECKQFHFVDAACFTPPSEDLSLHFSCLQRGHTTERRNVANIKTTDFIHRQEKPPIKPQNVKTTADIFLYAVTEGTSVFTRGHLETQMWVESWWWCVCTRCIE